MSAMEVDEFLENRAYKDAVRFHPIDWNATAIPIKRSDINWIDKDYQNDEYEFVQFHVSKAMGRVVGFFDEDNVFQVVLCDPLHNIQPAGDFDYRVRATSVGECALSRMVISYEQVIALSPLLTTQQKAVVLAELQTFNIGMFEASILLAVSDAHLKKAYELCATGAVQHIGELLELTIDENHETYIMK
ncbi:hypothetical protein [Bradyrhizobium sp. RT7b]|uniref:hypothetical protein n=1 Tax=unclassified Bradyrhizobium TaxID=2631580 RepID=UPI0033970ABE